MTTELLNKCIQDVDPNSGYPSLRLEQLREVANNKINALKDMVTLINDKHKAVGIYQANKRMEGYKYSEIMVKLKCAIKESFVHSQSCKQFNYSMECLNIDSNNIFANDLINIDLRTWNNAINKDSLLDACIYLGGKINFEKVDEVQEIYDNRNGRKNK